MAPSTDRPRTFRQRLRKLLIGKNLIGAYLGNSEFVTSFGAASSIIALLMWVYYSAQIFFLGAELTRQYALWFGSMSSVEAD